jgi:CBS domain-containing protein
MKVQKAMHKGVVSVSPETLVSEIAKRMREKDIGAIPVSVKGQLIGMITDRDIVCRGFASGRDLSKLTARDIMTEGVTYCTSAEEVEDALRIMEAKKIRRLPVMDGKKHFIGMLSLGDISHALPGNLSGEVVRAVADHHR